MKFKEELKWRGSNKAGYCNLCSMKHPRLSAIIGRKEPSETHDTEYAYGKEIDRVRRKLIRADTQMDLVSKTRKLGSCDTHEWQRVCGIVAYNGHGLHGFQRQNVNNKWTMPTVQTILEEAIAKALYLLEGNATLLGKKSDIQSTEYETIGPRWGSFPSVLVNGATRTDAGVAAEKQVFFFDLAWQILDEELSTLLTRINDNITLIKESKKLCYNIQVMALESVPHHVSFSPQRDAAGKRYCYTIFDGGVNPPQVEKSSLPTNQYVELYSEPIRKYHPERVKRLNDISMNEFAQRLVGTHNFRLFSRVGSSNRTDFIRHVSRARVFRTRYHVDPNSGCSYSFDGEHDPNGDFVHFVIEAPGFLYLMIRCIVTALKLVGEGKVDVDFLVSRCFNPPKDEATTRKILFSPAHPNGLTLATVYFNSEIFKGENLASLCIVDR